MAIGKNSVRIIIQSRLGSSRFPGKALLTIAGLPTVVLCAKRAQAAGYHVVVASTLDKTDDPLGEELFRHGLFSVRGNRDNVLGRFVLAAIDMDDDHIVVRLTADNVIPDGRFIAELVESLDRRDLQYLGTKSPEDGLPYGLSAEAFTVRVLREADRETTSAHDREHVTPWIIRKYRKEIFRPKEITGDLSHLRCTIDTFTDYQRMCRLFRAGENAVNVPWEELLRRLVNTEVEPVMPAVIRNGIRQSRLTLGTAQFGSHYGRTNRTGKPDDAELEKIIALAAKAGITHIDTARAYGDSEERLGDLRKNYMLDGFTVVTKLDPLAVIDESWSTNAIAAAVDTSVFRSCHALRTSTIDTLLLHRWRHRTMAGGVIWERLLQLREQGVIKTLGVSVQNPTEAAAALNDPDVHHIQLPFNIADYRWREARIPEQARKRPDVTIHARSVFLQGILVNEPGTWPEIGKEFAPTMISALDDLATRNRRRDRTDLCVAYTLGQEWIHSLVIGIEKATQLTRNIEALAMSPLSGEEILTVNEGTPRMPELILNPASWE